MISTFHRLQARLEARRCPTCRGRGECDDLEPGDIMGRTWRCESCKGTGLKPKFSPETVDRTWGGVGW